MESSGKAGEEKTKLEFILKNARTLMDERKPIKSRQAALSARGVSYDSTPSHLGTHSHQRMLNSLAKRAETRRKSQNITIKREVFGPAPALFCGTWLRLAPVALAPH